MMGPYLRVAVALGLSLRAVGLTGCNSHCTAGASRCNGNAIESCVDTSGDVPFAGGNDWSDQACSAPNPYCVVAGGAAVCSAAPTAVPECADATSQTCWKNGTAGCLSGFVVNFRGSCPDGTCTQRGGDCAFCDNGTTMPDPTCAIGAASTCVENAVYGCTCGGGRIGPPLALCDGGTCQEVSCGDASNCFAECL
jgi:hypothetical protein